MRGTLSKIRDEIDKCEVVCANCHRKRTAKRGMWYKDLFKASEALVDEHKALNLGN